MALQVISRAQWKAKKPKTKSMLNPTAIDELVIHYTSMDADWVKSHADCAERMRATQRYHQSADPSRKKKPWSDISYNFLFCHHGFAFEGRGWNVMSAATLGHNEHTQAICFLGGDSKDRNDFTPEAQRVAAELVHEFHRRYGPSRSVVGHRDRRNGKPQPGDCPGDEVYRWIKAKGWNKTPPAVDVIGEDGLPKWVWPWVEWQLTGREGKRPAGAPRTIPAFAWDIARNVERIGKAV